MLLTLGRLYRARSCMSILGHNITHRIFRIATLSGSYRRKMEDIGQIMHKNSMGTCRRQY
jgi:hypothetical protein